MKTNVTPAEETVGIMLASGFTKKEVAGKLDKSVRTVGRQSDELYKKTNSRNLADITRWVLQRYTGLPVEDIMINLVHDITSAGFVAFCIWAAFQPEVMEKLNAALSTVATFLTK